MHKKTTTKVSTYNEYDTQREVELIKPYNEREQKKEEVDGRKKTREVMVKY